MAEQTARDLMARHNITAEDIQKRRTSLHHVRRLVQFEEHGFDVFREIVKHRR